MWRSGWRSSVLLKELVYHGKPSSPKPCAVLGLGRFGNDDEECGSSLTFPARRGLASSSAMWVLQRRGFASSSASGDEISGAGTMPISFGEAKRLMRLVNVEALKTKLGTEGKEAIPYDELLDACQSIGVARSKEEAAAFARVLDDAGVIILFRDKVLLHPDRVVELVRRAVPLALTPDNDPVWEELKKLQEKKEQIDILAHRHVRRVLWGGLGLIAAQVGLFFRMTYWDFSWDVVEPLAYFTTTTCIGIGYAYFLITSRDPTYQDLMKRLFLRKQKKLIMKQNFDVEKFKEIQRKHNTTLHANASIKKKVGMEVELDDFLHKN